MNTQDEFNVNWRIAREGKGFTLLELLIAILVLAVGLLGLATMQAQGLKSNNSAEARTEATFLAMDIMDRMRANPNGVAAGSYAVNTGTVPADPGCNNNCTAAQRPGQDLYDWINAVSDQLGGGVNDTWRAVIAQTGGVFIVTIMWDDQRTGTITTGCGAGDMLCFQTLFQP